MKLFLPLLLLAASPPAHAWKPGAGRASSAPSAFILGADITPKIHADTVHDQWAKVALLLSVWQGRNERYLYGKGLSFGFEGERGEGGEWVELRFFAQRSIGLYHFGPEGWPAALWFVNLGGASIGPILEISTKSLLSQGIGVKADLWHMIGPLGAQFDVRLLSSKGWVLAGGLMLRVALPIFL